MKRKDEVIAKKETLKHLKVLSTLVYSIVSICSVLLFYGLLGDNLFNKRSSEFSETEYMVSQVKKNQTKLVDSEEIENGIHLPTGLVFAEGFQEVRATCTACHSAKLVTQNRATREGWKSMIRWMQETQGLWELGSIEPVILDYLAEHYAPSEVSRRENLDIAAIQWFILDLDK